MRELLAILLLCGTVGLACEPVPTDPNAPPPDPNAPPPVGMGPTMPTIPPMSSDSTCPISALAEFDLSEDIGGSGPFFLPGTIPELRSVPQTPFPDRTELIAQNVPPPPDARCFFPGLRILSKFPQIPKLPLLLTDNNPPTMIMSPSISVFVEDSMTVGGCRVAENFTDFQVGGRLANGLVCESMVAITYLYNESREAQQFIDTQIGPVRIPRLKEEQFVSTVRYTIITPDSWIVGLFCGGASAPRCQA